MLYIPVNSCGHVGMLPPFYGTCLSSKLGFHNNDDTLKVASKIYATQVNILPFHDENMPMQYIEFCEAEKN